MSNLPNNSTLIHKDDEQKLTSTSRITSSSIIKRQQNNETKTANEQAYDEIHDIRPKHSSFTKLV